MKFDYKREEKIRSVAGGGWGFGCLFYCEKNQMFKCCCGGWGHRT